MITLILGKPGSGKSYYAVYNIVKSIASDRKIFSNIFINLESANFIFMDTQKLLEFFSIVESIYIQSAIILDTEKIYQIFRQKGIESCDFWIDEAHLFGFNNSKKKDFLNFFLSLHRHLNINIFLITQSKKQFAPVFHDLVENVISALSPSQRLFPNVFEYKLYTSVDFVGKPNDSHSSIRYKVDGKIFDLYTSGDNNKGDNSFRKKVLFLLLIVFFLLFFIVFSFPNFSKSSTTTTNTTTTNTTTTNTTTTNNNTTTTNNNTTTKYFLVDCNFKTCNVDNTFGFCYRDFLIYIQKNNIETKKFGLKYLIENKDIFDFLYLLGYKNIAETIVISCP